MPKSRLSGPLLPAKYIQEVESHDAMRDFESSVYEQAAHEERLAMRQWLKPLSPDHPVGFRRSTCFTEEAQRTYLHHYAMEGDVLALSELIGLGATPDKADSYGITPLHLIFMEMEQVKSPEIAVFQIDRKTLMGAADRGRLFSRLAWVARILIEQHADVKIKVREQSLIGLSCSWQDWDTVTLLLKHGATLSPSTMSCFKSPSDRKQFTDLLRSVGSGHSRPPRVCPCWSGKLVPDCHGQTEQSYRLEFVCVCGSAKTYQQCCYTRGKFVTEKWDRKSQRILHDYDRIATLPKALREKFQDIDAYHKKFRETGDKLGLNSDVLKQQKKMAAELLSKGLIDPAFAYAMERANFVPQPHGRNSSHHLRKEMQTSWNKFVDAYIAEGNDSRSKEEIERLAKVGSGNGALFRRCEGTNCGNVEETGVKFDCCANCKFAVYCSRSCQKSAWRTHKAVCCSEDQREQFLPSQDAIQKNCRQLLDTFDMGEANAVLSVMDHILSSDSLP